MKELISRVKMDQAETNPSTKDMHKKDKLKSCNGTDNQMKIMVVLLFFNYYLFLIIVYNEVYIMSHLNIIKSADLGC